MKEDKVLLVLLHIIIVRYSRQTTSRGKIFGKCVLKFLINFKLLDCVGGNVTLTKSNRNEGYGMVRVEINGAVCGDEWGSIETLVVCRELGFLQG